MVNALDALKHLCDKCHKNIQMQSSKGYLPHKECPWRHISNDYCPDYEIIRNALLNFVKLDVH